MTIEQIYTGCLAQGAYYIESDGEAVVIDPLREVQPYLDRANKNGAKIKYILETHFHADFVSGHLDLAKKSGGTIVFGPTAKAAQISTSKSFGKKFMYKLRIPTAKFGIFEKQLKIELHCYMKLFAK